MVKKSNTALLIINYGTPENSGKKAVKKFLKELLDSKHVVTMNSLGRKILVNGIIVPSRLKHSSKNYENLEKKYGMLLKNHTENFAQKVQNILNEKADVYTAMTAGYNYMKDILEEIHQKNYHKIVAVPMYPQYTESTWGKALDDLYGFFKGKFNIPIINVFDMFFQDEYYVDSISKLLTQNLEGFDFERIVFSYHGVPLSHLKMAHQGKTCEDYNCQDHYSDATSHFCYLAQCYQTTRLITERLSIENKKVTTSFQSRIAEGWTQPYTEDTIMKAAKDGVKKIAVITPAFVTDCLETVIEIGEDVKEKFLQNGGTDFKLIPCLNDEDFWVENFCKMIDKML